MRSVLFSELTIEERFVQGEDQMREARQEGNVRGVDAMNSLSNTESGVKSGVDLFRGWKRWSQMRRIWRLCVVVSLRGWSVLVRSERTGQIAV